MHPFQIALALLVMGWIMPAAQAAKRASVFRDAVALWHFNDLNDSVGHNSVLRAEGPLKTGVALRGAERKASLARGGDGMVAQVAGGAFDAGQGANNELQIGGDTLTMLIRLRDPSGAWNNELFAKHGGHEKLAYNIYTYDFGQGTPKMKLGFEIGLAQSGFHGINATLSALGNPTGWFDIIARYDGRQAALFVNGHRVAIMAANGPLRANSLPCRLASGFHGQIDHAAIWNRALSDKEISRLSNAPIIIDDPAAREAREAQALIERNSQNPQRFTEDYRPQFHFTTIEGWMNDPNGLVFFRNRWHLFLQTSTSQQAWGHAVSRDLLHWEHLPPALKADGIGSIWSGSAVVDWKDRSGFFGGKPGLVCIFTYQNPNEGGRQSQAIAYSADGVHFTKYKGNPVIPQLRYQAGQPDDADFRDPKVIWHEATQRWIMIVAGGKVRFYSSPNLRDWTFESINTDINTECPDLFPLRLDNRADQTRWILNGGGRWYIVGAFDGHRFTPQSDQIPLNYGRDFYASQTWSDVPDGRRIMTTWLYNWGYENWPTKPWSGGSLTLPTEISLRQTAAGPRIFSVPARETQALRGAVQQWTSVSVVPGANLLQAIRGKTFEIEAEWECDPATPTAETFGFKIPGGQGEQTIVGYRPADQKMFVDRRGAGFAAIPHFNEIYEAPLPLQNNRIRLHCFIDHNSVELFGNDGAAVIFSQILPDPKRDGLELFASGGTAKLVSLKLYPLRSVWRDGAQ